MEKNVNNNHHNDLWDELHRITRQLENPRESYDRLAEELLELITQAEIAAIKHRTTRRGRRITDNNIKDIYLAKSMVYNLLTVLGWDDADR